MNLSIKNDWFVCYKGFIYANKPLDVHTRINNKVVIEKMYVLEHVAQLKNIFNLCTN